MRFFCLLLLSLCAVGAHAASVTTVRLWTNYRTADSFERISEFFDGVENTGGELVLRTQSAHRDGFYFLSRLKNDGAPLSGLKLELKVLPPQKTTPVVYTQFPALDLPAGQTVFHLGVTGSDWPNPKLAPIAWQITLFSASGDVIWRERSFLWGNAD